jgi:hypothetical protein
MYTRVCGHLEGLDAMVLSRVTAARIQQAALWTSTLLGSVSGTLFVAGSDSAWAMLHPTFTTTLLAGMVTVVAAYLSGRVRSGDWRRGLRLSLLIFNSQTTSYLLPLLLLALLGPASSLAAASWSLLLYVVVLPLYGSSLFATLLSGPMYLPWVPVPHDRR